MLHEADLFGGQLGEGLGGTTIEHRIARSADASWENDYENCLYACRFCNRSRSAKPLLLGSARLLDPTRDPWGGYFSAVEDRLQPAEGDAHSQYTHEAYALDDPRKVERRRSRRELVSDRLRLLTRLDAEVAELLVLASEAKRQSVRIFGEILQEIRDLRSDAKRALQDLKRYASVPGDAPETCRCASTHNHSLPEELGQQMLEIPEPDRTKR